MTEQEAKAAVAAHYGMLLGIASPWVVKEARLEVAARRMDIEVRHDPAQPVRCPQCRRECARHDHAPERTWRHLDVMQFTTQIRARLPRCACQEHGIVTLVPPWAEPGSRFTLLFEAFAVQVLQACASLTQAAELLRLDWDRTAPCLASNGRHPVADGAGLGITRASGESAPSNIQRIGAELERHCREIGQEPIRIAFRWRRSAPPSGCNGRIRPTTGGRG